HSGLLSRLRMLRKLVAASLGVGEVVTAPVPADWNDFVAKQRVRRAKASVCRAELALDGERLALGGRGRGGAQVRRSGGARAQLDDPEAQDAVRDLQVVLELLEERARPADLQQVVVRVGLLVDLVGRGANAPVVTADDLAGAV